MIGLFWIRERSVGTLDIYQMRIHPGFV